MTFSVRRTLRTQLILLRVICVCVLAGILVAGLWPFHAPRNDVHWSSPKGGIVFGRHGSIVSAGSFGASPSPVDRSCSIEIWLEPDRSDSSGTILAFYRPAEEVVPFSLRQSLGDLVVQHGGRDRLDKKAKIYVNDVFSQLRPVFITISSGEAGTTVYLNGIVVKKAAGFKFSSQELTGQLVLGNAADTSNNWSGQLKRLAIYNRELPPAEVLEHFAEWGTGDEPHLDTSDGVIADYPFDEGQGSVVRNRVDSSTNLIIPGRFFVLHQPFLERPCDEFRSDWNYWLNVAINIGGFVPLGFFFRAYFSAVGKIKQGTWITIALGFAVSLTIEVLQAFLPTRDSGMTDLFTNTFGTALGAMLWVSGMKHNWFASPVTLFLPAADEKKASS